MLPPPIYNRPSFQVSNKVLNFVWSSSFILALLFSGVFFVKELRSTTNVDRISKEFSKRVSSIQKIANTNLREASVQSLNLADYVLGEVTQEKDKHAIADLLQRISPIYKNEFGDEFRSALKYFETLAFAPQELVKDIMTDKKFQSEFKVLKNTLHKVILIYSKNG